MFAPDETRQAILATLAATPVPPDHTVVILVNATLINQRPAASVLLAVRAGDHWQLNFGAEHTGLGDNIAGFAVQASY